MHDYLTIQQKIRLERAGVLFEVKTPIQKLYEEFLVEARTETENDDMGKLHELKLAYHLSADKDEDKHLPIRHAAEQSEDPAHNGNPEKVHKTTSDRLGPEKSQKVDDASRQSADEWKKKYLKKGEKIGEVAWTSNRDQINKSGEKISGDHEKTTGVHDPNSNADLMAKIVDEKGNHLRWAGISAKIGSQDPNLNNPGLDSLEKLSGNEKGHFNSLMKPHDELMQKIGYSGKSRDDRHTQWKIEQMATSPDPDKGVEGVRKLHKELEVKSAGGKKLATKDKKMYEHATTFLNAHDGLNDTKKKELLTSDKHRTQAAIDSGQQARRNISSAVAEGLSKQVRKSDDGTYDDSGLRDTINKMVSPKTIHHHSVVHSRLDDKGNFSRSEISDQETYASKHLNRFKNLKVAGGDGQSTYIKGELNQPGHPKHGKEMNVAQFTTKSNSGPMQNTVGTFKLANKEKDVNKVPNKL